MFNILNKLKSNKYINIILECHVITKKFNQIFTKQHCNILQTFRAIIFCGKNKVTQCKIVRLNVDLILKICNGCLQRDIIATQFYLVLFLCVFNITYTVEKLIFLFLSLCNHCWFNTHVYKQHVENVFFFHLNVAV